MKKNYISFIFFVVSSIVFAQQMPIDFNSNNHTFTVFGDLSTANPPNKFDVFSNPEDGSDLVGRFFMDGNNPNDSQGYYIDLSTPVNFDTNKILTMDFFKYDGDNHTVTLKMQQGGGNPDVEVTVNISGGPGTWSNNLQFDFANAVRSSDNSAINVVGNYSRLTLFIDKGVANKPPGTFLVDDINDGSTASDPHPLDVVYNDLVWEDNFDGSAIDNTKWHHQTLVIIEGVGWANGEDQHYTDRPENSFVQDGDLHIVAKREQYTSEGITMPFTSARLNSKFAFTYGRVDVRAKLPEGLGTWPAIWMLGRNINERGGYFQPQYGAVGWPDCGEIDIMEHGLGAVNEVSAALHTPSSFGATVNFKKKTISDVADNYHVYSMNWSPNRITFLIDGEGYYTYNPADKNSSTWPFDAPQYLLLNIAMGGTPVNGGNVDPNFTESSMIIDYVRVYQNTTASTEDVFASKFTVYPNPISDRVNIKTDEIVDKVEIYSLLGQLVLSKKNTKSIETYRLQSGMYLMNIFSNGRKATKKIIVK